jgi:hypothetical protein
MRQLSGGTTTRGFAVAILSVGGVAGFLAFGGTASWSDASAQTVQLTPSQTVNYRFPPNWHTAASAPSSSPASSAASAPARPGAASATASREAPQGGERQALASLMFNPTSNYGLASASSTPVTLPDRANAYADPSIDSDARRASTAATAPAGERTASIKPTEKATDKASEKNTTNVARQQHKAAQSPYVLNDAQIASIKVRLKLTPDQQRSWPAVEAALRNITYKTGTGSRGKMAAVDPNSPAVQQLKSAAIPLIMSFSDAQKDEVRQLARLMGLEQVASSF